MQRRRLDVGSSRRSAGASWAPAGSRPGSPAPSTDNPRGRLQAVASRDPERGRAFADRHGAATVHPTYDALLADPAVDVIYVALPNGLHAEWTVRALEAGKHVLCEKPLALTVAEVDAIAAAAARNDRIAVEAFMYLHHPQTLKALEIARDGTLGELQVVSAAFSFFLDYPNDPRVDPDLGGGSLWDVGCYPVSISRRIAGEEPDGIAAFARFDERGVDRIVRRRAPLPERSPGPLRERLHRSRPRAGRDRRQRRDARARSSVPAGARRPAAGDLDPPGGRDRVDRGRIDRRLPRRGRRPPGGDPGRDATARDPRVQSR